MTAKGKHGFPVTTFRDDGTAFTCSLLIILFSLPLNPPCLSLRGTASAVMRQSNMFRKFNGTRLLRLLRRFAITNGFKFFPS
jgi:hypothetical protein